MGDLAAAMRHLRRAARVADTAGERARSGEVRRSLVFVLVERGDLGGALAAADAAVPALRGTGLARVLSARGMVLERMGRMSECFESYGRALSIVRRAAAPALEGRVLCNRGLAHVAAGDLGAAASDLARAESLSGGAGDRGALAKVRHNLAIVAARQGDAPRALRLLDQAEELFTERQMHLERAIVPRDRCSVLLSVRLVPEAREAAERAVAISGPWGPRRPARRRCCCWPRACCWTARRRTRGPPRTRPCWPSRASAGPAGPRWPAWWRRGPRGSSETARPAGRPRRAGWGSSWSGSGSAPPPSRRR